VLPSCTRAELGLSLAPETAFWQAKDKVLSELSATLKVSPVSQIGSWARLNCENMPVIPAWLVRSNLNDPRRIPYLLVWKDERDGEIKEAVRVAHFTACGREGNDYAELKRTDGTITFLRIVWRKLRGVRAAAVHPGVIETELGRHLDPAQIQALIDQISKERAVEGKEPFRWKTVPQGAATSVWAAVVAPAEEIGGKYCENCHVGEAVEDSAAISGVSEGVRGYALDPNNAEALWKKSEDIVGERFQGSPRIRSNPTELRPDF
jgi:hypothetical protein